PRQAGSMRHVRPDRDTDRSDVVVEGVPPPGRMTAPPGEDRRHRHPAQQPDRGLAVTGEDPVLAFERVNGAGLHRLVVPEDRVRADPALTVEDHRALVVGTQQHYRAVELEEVALLEPLDHSIRNRLAVSDHAPKVV